MSESTQGPFIPGQELNRQFFQSLIQPLLAEHLPQLDYVAALIGPGSDVLGYDTPRSMDHDWGPRLQILLPEAVQALEQQLQDLWNEHLPRTFRGFSVFYKPHLSGRLVPACATDQATETRIEVHGIHDFFVAHLGLDPLKDLSLLDWPTLPEQSLLELTAGAVYHDPRGILKQRRQTLAYFPQDIWLYRMACQWQRLAEIEAFHGRCAELDDVLGQNHIVGQIIDWAGNLQFLQARQYRPYTKWWGTALKPLFSTEMSQLLYELPALQNSAKCERQLGFIYQYMARQHNQLQLTPSISTDLKPYRNRPFQVIFAERFAQALQQAIDDPHLRKLPLYGAIDQISNQTQLLCYPQRRNLLAPLWEGDQ